MKYNNPRESGEGARDGSWRGIPNKFKHCCSVATNLAHLSTILFSLSIRGRQARASAKASLRDWFDTPPASEETAGMGLLA